jgi:hypothetical protein
MRVRGSTIVRIGESGMIRVLGNLAARDINASADVNGRLGDVSWKPWIRKPEAMEHISRRHYARGIFDCGKNTRLSDCRGQTVTRSIDCVQVRHGDRTL